MVFKFWFVATKNLNKKVEGVLKKHKIFGFFTLPSKILDKSGLPVLNLKKKILDYVFLGHY